LGRSDAPGGLGFKAALTTDQKIERLRNVIRRARLRKRTRTGFVRRYALWVRIHSRSVWAWFVCGIWLAVGFVYALAQEEWSATRALYFSVSSLPAAARMPAPFLDVARRGPTKVRRSTAGLQGIPKESRNWQYWFVAVWCLFGVPIFGRGLGEFAHLLVQETSEAESVANDWGKHGAEDWDAAVGALRQHMMHLADERLGDRLTREQFLVSQLILSGLLSHDLLEIVHDRFRAIDKDGDGEVTREEFLRHGGHAEEA